MRLRRSLSFFLAVLMFAILTACAGRPYVKPVVVEVPVTEPCRAPVVLHPVWPFEALHDKANLFEQTRALLAENELRQAYEARLEAAVKACQ